MNTPHPDLETLAELADRDNPPASEAAAGPGAAGQEAASEAATVELLGHVAGCAACTADLEALRGVRAALHALPPISMPADVAQRIEAALLAARASDAAGGPLAASGARSDTPAATVVPLRSRTAMRQRRGGAPSRWRTMPYGAAASIVVVLALVVVGAVAIGHSGGESKKSATAAASSSAASVSSATIASGTNYTAADLRSQVASVVASNIPDAASRFPGLAFGLAQGAGSAPLAAAAASSAPAAATSAAPAASFAAAAPTPAASASEPAPPIGASASASAAAGGTADHATVNGAPLAPITAPDGPLADPAALAACIQTLAGKAEQPLLVDYATFNGAPSTIIVLPDPDVPHKLDVYVIADTANCANNEFTFETFLGPTPGP